MHRPLAALTTALTLCCALSACGSDAPAADPTPSAVATPSASASKDPAKDPLYLEAVDVYKKYFAEMQKFEAAGYPTKTLPASMDAYITGSMKEAVQNGVTAALQQHLAPAKGSQARLEAVAPNPGVTRGASIVGIQVCVDGSRVRVVNTQTGADVGPGKSGYEEIFFTREGTQLKASISEGKVVEKCPIA